MKTKHTMNDEVIIHPSVYGIFKMIECIQSKYSISRIQAQDWVNKRITDDGGYKDQLWVIIRDYHSMFFNGQQYFADTYFDFINTTKEE